LVSLPVIVTVELPPVVRERAGDAVSWSPVGDGPGAGLGEGDGDGVVGFDGVVSELPQPVSSRPLRNAKAIALVTSSPYAPRASGRRRIAIFDRADPQDDLVTSPELGIET
jgi:hypothetical protein